MFSKPIDGIRYEAGSHCVLMLHGLGANSTELARLARDLYVQDFSVIAPNISGYCFGTQGKSWQHWLHQVQELLAELQQNYETVSVVGLSMGAALAMVLAQRSQVTSLVLLSTALAYDGWAMPWYQFLSHWASWLPFAKYYQFHEREPFGVKNEEMRAMIARAMKKDHISESGVDVLSLHYIVEGQRLIREARYNMDAIECPTLFIHSVDDESVHIRNIEWAYEEISSTDKDILYLGDSYHMITVDNERETVSQETVRFLKRAVNHATGLEVFEIPPVQSAELKRLLRKSA